MAEHEPKDAERVENTQQDAAAEMENELQGSKETEAQKPDIFIYSGGINRNGYAKLCDILDNEPPENGAQEALLILGTSGGDADAAFRIARALHHHYPKGFKLFIPGYCKSAGTLIAIGASSIIIADEGELGPLDVQISKRDELFERSSGLDLPQAIDYLGSEVRNSFKNALVEIKLGGGLSTAIASKIATELTVGTFSQIYAQIDPAKIGENQRATMIAHAYGERLAKKSGNLQPDGLARIMFGYPSHSFVIDRKEARELFVNIERPDPSMIEAMKELRNLFKGEAVNSRNPIVYDPLAEKTKEEKSKTEQPTSKPRESDHDEHGTEKISAPPKRRARKKRAGSGKETDN